MKTGGYTGFASWWNAEKKRVPKDRMGAALDGWGAGYRCASAVAEQLKRDAERYRWLRERDLDTLHAGGVFAGKTPDNVVLNGVDLDAAIDAGMTPEEAQA